MRDPLILLPFSGPSSPSPSSLVSVLPAGQRRSEPHSPCPSPVISCDKCLGDVMSLFSPSRTLSYNHRFASYMEMLLMFVLSTQLIMQSSHFSLSCLFPHMILSCCVPHSICLCSLDKPQENSFSWLVEMWISCWGRCPEPLLIWLLGLYLPHGVFSTSSSLTMASGAPWSFTHSCSKAFILLPLLCLQAVYPPFLFFRHLQQEKQAASTLPLLGFPLFQSSHNTLVLPVPFTAMFLISFSISTTPLRG